MQPDSDKTSEFLYGYASRIWDRIRFARIRQHRISETTITENLIFDFWYQAQKDDVAIEIYEAKDEQRTGNDLELYIETKRGYLLMACQAKILSKQNKYPNISHKVNDNYQIDLLLDYGRSRGGIACYLFYNYISDWNTLKKLEASGKYQDTHFGLTSCNAEFIKLAFFKPGSSAIGKKRVKIPTFEDIHPLHGFPLPEMIRILRDETALDIIAELAKHIDVPLTYYTKNEITTEEYPWEPVIALPKISGIAERKQETITPRNQPKAGFNPKYRIVFPLTKQRYFIRILS
jgi:hypothetical protein